MQCNTVCSRVHVKVTDKKLGRSKNKQELINCLQEMAEGADESTDSSTEWVRVVDGGGLIHVNED